jgi:uncharacterized membrane protein
VPHLRLARSFNRREKIAIVVPRPSDVVRRSVLLLVGGALLVGCAPQGKVTSYTPAVEQNFTTACEARTDVSAVNASLCTCVFEKLKAGMDFVDFKKLDADLQQAIKDATVKSADDVRQKFPAYAVIVASCVESGPKAP